MCEHRLFSFLFAEQMSTLLSTSLTCSGSRIRSSFIVNVRCSYLRVFYVSFCLVFVILSIWQGVISFEILFFVRSASTARIWLFCLLWLIHRIHLFWMVVNSFPTTLFNPFCRTVGNWRFCLFVGVFWLQTVHSSLLVRCSMGCMPWFRFELVITYRW